MLPAEYRAMRELRRNASLVILPADKGRATVVMEKSEYEEKRINMLSDVTTYNKDPTPSLERRMNALLFAMRKQNKLGKELYNRLRSSAGHVPAFRSCKRVEFLSDQ